MPISFARVLADATVKGISSAMTEEARARGAACYVARGVIAPTETRPAKAREVIELARWIIAGDPAGDVAPLIPVRGGE